MKANRQKKCTFLTTFFFNDPEAGASAFILLTLSIATKKDSRCRHTNVNIDHKVLHEHYLVGGLFKEY